MTDNNYKQRYPIPVTVTAPELYVPNNLYDLPILYGVLNDRYIDYLDAFKAFHKSLVEPCRLKVREEFSLIDDKLYEIRINQRQAIKFKTIYDAAVSKLDKHVEDIESCSRIASTSGQEIVDCFMERSEDICTLAEELRAIRTNLDNAYYIINGDMVYECNIFGKCCVSQVGENLHCAE